MINSEDVLLSGAISRIGVWLDSLSSEFASAKFCCDKQQDAGAINYISLLEALLYQYRKAYDRYRVQAAAPTAQRLQWLQQVGAGLAVLENLFGRLSIPVAPALTPMLAAFSRLVKKLLPDRSAIFRPVRDFNYELEEFHSSDFEEVLPDTGEEYHWPVLFITLPTGLLDTPRAHVLISHELGHAIAAVHRERVTRNEQERNEAVAAGKEPPLEIAPLLPELAPPRPEVLRIAKERWTEHGLPVPQVADVTDQSINRVVLLETIATVASEVSEWSQSWLEELFSDAIGTCLFGPAFLISILEVLLTTCSMDRGTASHPPLAARIECIGRTLQHEVLGFSASSFPPKLKQRFERVLEEAQKVLKRPNNSKGSDGLLADLVGKLVLEQMGNIVATAILSIRNSELLYDAKQFASDIGKYVNDFVAGVPPIEPNASLATVFNVGQLLCTDYMDQFCPGVDEREKEHRVDDLLLKAIELNEIATTWLEA